MEKVSAKLTAKHYPCLTAWRLTLAVPAQDKTMCTNAHCQAEVSLKGRTSPTNTRFFAEHSRQVSISLKVLITCTTACAQHERVLTAGPPVQVQEVCQEPRM